MAKSFFQIALSTTVPILSFFLWFLSGSASAFAAPDNHLSFQQSQAFRAWFKKIVQQQLTRGPNPRWTHQDCAGLVRFSAAEAMKKHDSKWRTANGLTVKELLPEVNLTAAQLPILNRWKQIDGKTYSPYVSAIGLIQENSRFVSTDINQARVGDLLFFDQGEDQHLMIWMGTGVAYHTGESHKNDTGLRKVSIEKLMNWKDTRWQPRPGNPNFIGIYRLSFLSH